MIFKNLYINIIIRVLLIAFTCFLFFFANEKYNDIVININIIAFFIIQLVLLIRKLNFFNRDLIAFFDSLKYDDSSILITNESQDINYLRLSRRLQVVNKQILELKEKGAKQDHYFKTITEIANVGLLSFDETGKVKLANKAIKDMLKLDKLTHINDLNNLYSDFSTILNSLKPSEHKVIKISPKLTSPNEVLQLSLRLADFKTKDEKLKIVSIHNIKNELDEKELEAWQRLIRTLRHEIMNSIGPISSTIETLNEIITDPNTNKTLHAKQISDEHVNDIAEGLKIINERNIGLQKFVDNFRSISKLPKPEFEHVFVNSFFEKIESLWKKEFKKQNIYFKYESNDDFKLIADKALIEQVIINLIKNSIEANCTDLFVKVYKTDNDSIRIEITDNGKGIPLEVIDEIFLPFYSTKEQGSGIGLSLARQIMRLHGGNISVQSTSDSTTFILEF